MEIGGDGDILPLQNLVKKNNAEDFITVFGEISHHEVAEKMKRADCFVLFSNYENLPCVLLESMSCGVPVIATKVGGIPEMVDENAGILIDISFDELLSAMEKVVTRNVKFDSPEKLHQKISDNYSMEKIGKKISDIYEKVLA